MYNENQSACRCGKCHSHKHQKSSGAIKQGQIQVITNDSNLEATLLTSYKSETCVSDRLLEWK